MASSFVASFLIFIITGLYSIFVSKIAFSSDPVVNILVYAVIFANAAFYYYFAGQEEMQEDLRAKLATVRRREWVLRLLNQTLSMSIWFVFGTWGFVGLRAALFGIYLTYLAWDYVVWAALGRDRSLVWLDLFGFLLTIFFLVVAYDQSERGRLLLGMVLCGYLLLIAKSIKKAGWNPFDGQYWKKPSLH
jgi:hypothetical protein